MIVGHRHVWHKESVTHVYPHPRFVGGTFQTWLLESCHLCGRRKSSAWLGLMELSDFDIASQLDGLKLKCMEE